MQDRYEPIVLTDHYFKPFRDDFYNAALRNNYDLAVKKCNDYLNNYPRHIFNVKKAMSPVLKLASDNNLSAIKSLLKHLKYEGHKADAVYGLAKNNFTSSVDTLINSCKNKNKKELLISAALRGFAEGGHLQPIESLINKDNFSDVSIGLTRTKLFDNSTSAAKTLVTIGNSSIRKLLTANPELRTHCNNKGFQLDSVENYITRYESQYQKQQSLSHRIKYITLIILGILVLPLLPLAIFIWRKGNPLQRVEISQEEVNEVKAKRTALRLHSNHSYFDRDNNAPKKVMLSPTDPKTNLQVYLMDRPQLARFRFFAHHDQNYLSLNKDKILSEMDKSKEKSRKLMANF